MPEKPAAAELKTEVQEFWDAEPCGSRYLGTREDFEAHARARHELEPFIREFAGFESAAGKRVLEIGVGMGPDYLEWLKAGARATGIDLSRASLERARRRCEMAGYSPDLQEADAEHLPFPENTFDIVYSYGVMHHSPDTAQCIREARRVLRTGRRSARYDLPPSFAHGTAPLGALWLAAWEIDTTIGLRSSGKSGHEFVHGRRGSSAGGGI